MGYHVTDERHVALYCSTDGVAFGPVFSDESEAVDFLEWLSHRVAQKSKPSEFVKMPNGQGYVHLHDDPRLMSTKNLVAAVNWFRQDAEAWGNDDASTDLLVPWLIRKGR